MLSNIAVAALAAIGTVSAGPLQRRQATSAVESVTSAVESAVSSAVESATSGASSVASGASSAVSGATSTGAESSAASSTEAPSSAASSAATSGGGAGNETYPAYPCPAGFLLTYASVNQTVPVSVTQVTQAAGQWADSPLFPNVTDAQGGNDAGATHTINVGGISLPEVLISAESNTTSGSAIWNWNGSLTEPVSAMGVSLSNYSTVLQIYDPDYTTTGTIGNTTLIKIFTNACATPQAEAVQLLTTLGGLELSNIAGALGGNSTEGGETTAASSAAPESTTSGASESATSAASEATSGAESATSAAASGAESATSAAASGVESAISGATSAAAGATSAA